MRRPRQLSGDRTRGAACTAASSVVAGGIVTREELVVLVDEAGQQIGTAAKAAVHGGDTPSHRAFSCYLFGPDGLLLLTRRARTKATFPGLWTNSVCGHPGPGEDDVNAIRRRARHEMGLPVTDPQVAIADFRYRATSGGVMENEICPVYLARTDGTPDPEPAEVDDWTWCPWPDFLARLAIEPARFSPWCRDQAARLHTDQIVPIYLNQVPVLPSD